MDERVSGLSFEFSPWSDSAALELEPILISAATVRMAFALRRSASAASAAFTLDSFFSRCSLARASDASLTACSRSSTISCEVLRCAPSGEARSSKFEKRFTAGDVEAREEGDGCANGIGLRMLDGGCRLGAWPEVTPPAVVPGEEAV